MKDDLPDKIVEKLNTIALVGPQSTGKSTLAKQLAEKYQTIWVEEYARTYFTNQPRAFVYEDVEYLASEQLKISKLAYQKANRFLFFDTDILTTLVWGDIYFQQYPAWVLEHIRQNPHHLYLLLEPDLPYTEEPQRESQAMQAIFFERFKHFLTLLQLPFVILGGQGELRLINGFLACEAQFFKYGACTLFADGSSPFSQWYPSNFVADGVEYCCAEQFMMHKKALLFHDESTAKRIMATSSPKEHQALGRLVKNFDSQVWKRHCKSIVYKGNYAKFSQNKDLGQLLKNTRNSLLVEAYDQCQYWSVGLPENNPDLHDPSLWKGKNWMGFILTSIREAIFQDGK